MKKKVLVGLGAAFSVAGWIIGMITDEHDREEMKAEIKEEILEEMSTSEEEES